MKNANINALRDYVSIYKRTKSKTQHGATQYTYTLFAENIPANVEGYGTTVQNGQYLKLSEISWKVIMRYRDDIHTGDRIAYMGKTLEMQSEPIPIEARRNWILVYCKEILSG